MAKQIRVAGKWGSKDWTGTVRELVQGKIDDIYGNGQVENLQQRVTSAAVVLGRLMECLVERNAISVDDVGLITDEILKEIES